MLRLRKLWVQVTVLEDPKIAKALDTIAEVEGTSRADLVRQAHRAIILQAERKYRRVFLPQDEQAVA